MPEDCIVPGFLAARAQVLRRNAQLAFTYDTWDATIRNPKIVVDADGTYRMFYTGVPASGFSMICTATSTDMVRWTKPVLNLSTYGANNNVLQIVSNARVVDAFVDPVSGKTYVVVFNVSTSAAFIYEYLPGVVLTYIGATGTITSLTGDAPEHAAGWEPKPITYNPTDGKYRWWYTENGTAERRSIGYYDSAALTGPWVNRGVLADFTSAAAATQYWDFAPFHYAGSLWAAVGMYDQATGTMYPVRLYRSESNGNAGSWVRTTDLIRAPVAGAWDRALLSMGKPILVEGVWYFIYGGGPVTYTFGLATATAW